MSFGVDNADHDTDCLPSKNLPLCLTITYAVSRDVAMVASSGNVRSDLDFPASDTRVISAGGFQSDLGFGMTHPAATPIARSIRTDRSAAAITRSRRAATT